MTKEEEIQSLKNQVEELKKDRHRLVGAIRWALGYTDFERPQGKEGTKPHWWRSKLRELAGIEEKKYIYWRDGDHD